MTPEELREQVAEAIHDEWQKWAENIMPELQVLTRKHLPYGREVEAGNCACKTCQRIKRWQEMFKPYPELPENIKAYDRPWARQILSQIRQAVEGLENPSGGERGEGFESCRHSFMKLLGGE